MEDAPALFLRGDFVIPESAEELRPLAESLLDTNRKLQSRIDDLFLEHVTLIHEHEALTRAVKDASLSHQAQMLDKDLLITQLQIDLANLQIANASNTGSIAAQQQEQSYQSAINEVSDQLAQALAREKVLELQLSSKDQVQTLLHEHQNLVMTRLQELQTLAELQDVNLQLANEVISALQDQERDREIKLNQQENEMKTLMDALDQSLVLLAQERVDNTARETQLREEKAAAVHKLEAVKPQLISTWDALAEQRKKTGPTAATWAFSESLRLLDENGQASEDQAIDETVRFLGGSLGSDAALPLNALRNLISVQRLHEVLGHVNALARHIVVGQLSESIAVAKQNPAAMKKDAQIIPWIFQSVKDLSDLAFWIQEFVACSTSEDSQISVFEVSVGEQAGDDQSLIDLLNYSREQLLVLSKAFLTDSQSTSLSTEPLTRVSRMISDRLGQVNKASGPRLVSSDFVNLTLLRTVAACAVSILSGQNSEYSVEDSLNLCSKIIENPIFERKNPSPFSFSGGDSLKLSLKAISTDLNLFTLVCQNLSRFENSIGVQDADETWSLHGQLARRFDPANPSAIPSPTRRPLRAIETFLDHPVSYAQKSVTVAKVQIPQWKNRGMRMASAVMERAPQEDTSQAIRQDFNARIILLETELEGLRMRLKGTEVLEQQKDELLTALSAESRVRAETAARLDAAGNDIQTFKQKIRDLEGRLQELEDSTRDEVPVSVASFELAKTRASLKKLVGLFEDLQVQKMKADWNLISSLDHSRAIERAQSPPQKSLVDLERRLQFRRQLLDIALVNPGLNALAASSGLTGVKASEVIRDELKVKEKLIMLKTQYRDLAKVDSEEILHSMALKDEVQPNLLARIPSNLPRKLVSGASAEQTIQRLIRAFAAH